MAPGWLTYTFCWTKNWQSLNPSTALWQRHILAIHVDDHGGVVCIEGV